MSFDGSIEQRLLAAVADDTPGCRVVYADWLEEHARLAQAEYLRLQDELSRSFDDARFDARLERFERIAESLEHAWRLAVRDRALDERIAKLIESLWRRNSMNLSATAREMDIDRQRLRRMIRRYVVAQRTVPDDS